MKDKIVPLDEQSFGIELENERWEFVCEVPNIKTAVQNLIDKFDKEVESYGDNNLIEPYDIASFMEGLIIEIFGKSFTETNEVGE